MGASTWADGVGVLAQDRSRDRDRSRPFGKVVEPDADVVRDMFLECVLEGDRYVVLFIGVPLGKSYY
jgi:hypothetical protein